VLSGAVQELFGGGLMATSLLAADAEILGSDWHEVRAEQQSVLVTGLFSIRLRSGLIIWITVTLLC